jgi:hypothetical protein
MLFKAATRLACATALLLSPWLTAVSHLQTLTLGAALQRKGHGTEGVEMSDAKIAAANIEVLSASGETLRDSIVLNGIL